MPDTLTNYEKNLWSKYMILIENNFGENYAYTRQNENIYLLNGVNRGWNYFILAGPYSNQYADLVVENKFTQPFETEPGYQYLINKGLIKQKQLATPYLFKSYLSAAVPQYNFHDMVLTENEIDSLWENYLETRSINEDLFYNPMLDKFNNGELQIGVNGTKKNDSVVIKNILLFSNSNPDFIRVYKGSARDLGYIQPGLYRLFFLLEDDQYFIKDSIVIQKNGINYYITGSIIPKLKDSVSIHISEIIRSMDRGLHNSQSPQADRIKELFNDRFIDGSSFNQTIKGTIRDDKGNPVVGATVSIKGTRFVTLTDLNGQFSITTPSDGSIVVSYVGYSTQEVKINKAIDFYGLSLVPMQQNLNEVVVIGYGTQRKKEVAYSVTSVSSETLMGRVPGVTVQADSMVMPIMVRGAASLKFSRDALIIVDGIPVDQNTLKQIDENLIENIYVLKDEAATAIYGLQAANGVIIITTKRGILKNALQSTDLPFAGNSLRNNFRDYAYWQPHLSNRCQREGFF